MSINDYTEMAQATMTTPRRLSPDLKRKTLGPLRRRAERKALDGTPRQERLLDDLRTGDYLLVVLDACRYDFFADAARRYLRGRSRAAASAGYDTAQYLSGCWADSYPDTTYVSGASPVASEETLEVEDHGRRRYGGEYTPSEHLGEIVDVWDRGRDPSAGTCPPEAVLSATLDRLGERRLVAHFFQPHAPYIGRAQGVAPSDDRDAVPTDSDLDVAPIRQRVREGDVSDDRLRGAYQSNLHRATACVCRLIAELRSRGDKRRVVVTSDHGEALGEYGVYSHPHEPHPGIRLVPWMEVSGVSDLGRSLGEKVDAEGV